MPQRALPPPSFMTPKTLGVGRMVATPLLRSASYRPPPPLFPPRDATRRLASSLVHDADSNLNGVLGGPLTGALERSEPHAPSSSTRVDRQWCPTCRTPAAEKQWGLSHGLHGRRPNSPGSVDKADVKPCRVGGYASCQTTRGQDGVARLRLHGDSGREEIGSHQQSSSLRPSDGDSSTIHRLGEVRR
ncbi:hypothetical protein PR202_gb24363 [Eleusine coracana subsp. coracana]|uniref:Uncharacterized protein n=1 Tax=Eleusine coracana subsp. coracana TaxID=191504 RepID=A0AAV5FLG4_ELECO|nr:hypothetical protein PR202_gb24363 [Eleusine coracana subsp. coracana]